MLAAWAPGQQLNLDRPNASRAGEARSALALADELIDEAEALLASGERAPSIGARAALRAVGADLLRAGEEEAGARATLIGRTIALRRPELDAAIGVGDASAAGRFVAAALARDLAARPPFTEADAIERWLRDSLWPLVREGDRAPGIGWVTGERDPVRPLSELAALTGLNAEGLLTVGEFEGVLEGAAAIPVYRPASEDVRRSAAAVLAAMSEANSRLLAPAVRELIRDEFIRAADAFSAPPDAGARIAAALRLRRLGVLCGALVKVASLDTASPTVRILRGAVEEFATAGAWRDDDTAGSRLRLVIDVIDRASPDPAVADDRTLARQFRPAMRIIEPLARQSGMQTLEVAPRLLSSGAAASDPGVLGAITAHARRLNDVRLLRGAADAVAEPGRSGEPEVPAERRFLAERFVTLGQDLGRPERRDLAISELRDLCQQVGSWKSIEGEAELRAGAEDEGWHGATDSKLADLGAAVDRVRQDWIGSWTTPRALPAAATTRRLALLRDNLHYIADAAGALNVGAGLSRLNSWPGWELSPGAGAWLAAGLAETAQAMTSGLITGAEDGVTGPRKRLVGEFALALTVGRLERRAGALGVAVLPPGPGSALAQFLSGPAPSDAWMGAALEDLAVMCRAIEEAADAARDPDRRAESARFKAAAEIAARAVALRLDAEDERLRLTPPAR